MRSHDLRAAATELLREASTHLQGLLAAGAEVRFELEGHSARRRGGQGAPVLYAYRAMTGEFIDEHRAELERLRGHGALAAALEGFAGLERYLASVGLESARADRRMRVRAAIGALLHEAFEEQSDFELRDERMHAALERLERSALSDGRETTIVATLHGLAIGSEELALTKRLMIARPQALEGLPEQALAGAEHGAQDHLIVALAAGESEPQEAIAQARELFADLLRALRLFGDGRVTLGELAWARVAGGRWRALALGHGGRPHGMLVVAPEQEDELRAFCSLVSRRAPDGNELAWALGRFELGCERASALDGLSDHLMALRALLEPEGPASALLPGRLSALCATPERRLELNERVLAALALERQLIAGTGPAPPARRAAVELARELANHLRALLRDVICGHLDQDLISLADQLLAPAEQPDGAPAEARAPALAPEQADWELGWCEPLMAASGSGEQVAGDSREAPEILDVFI
ncbi:MAG TPA: hypothetical protein VL979_09810 [Solirubrobacteraceae bacterium]|nr:hypothetical protein [Solirubrobacteraceae bacterium]